MKERRPSAARDARIAALQDQAKRFKVTAPVAVRAEIQPVLEYAVPSSVVPRPVDGLERQLDDLG